MVFKGNRGPLESLTVFPVDKSTNDRDNLIGSEKTGLNEPNGYQLNLVALARRPWDAW